MITITYPGKFDPTTGTWQGYTKEADTTTDRLTLVTYNVCFDKYYLRERTENLLKIIKACDADIICLQEVTPPFLTLVLKQEWVQTNYYISDYTGRTIQPYGVLLLSRFPIARVFLHQLPTRMARKLLVVEPKINGQTVTVATVHLESGGKLFAFARKQQLELIFPVLSKTTQAILMGDMNFCSSWREENALITHNNYQDMWAVLRGNELGYTEDTDINLMRLELNQSHKKVRYDRILARSLLPEWQPKSIELLGTSSISAEHPNIFPSDHFGLVGKLAWNLRKNG